MVRNCPNPNCEDGLVEVVDYGAPGLSLERWQALYPKDGKEECSTCQGTGEVEGPAIAAYVALDTGLSSVEFDAEDWFKQCSVKEFRELQACGFGGDSPADAVARFFEETTTRVVFAQVDLGVELNLPIEQLGFECHVDPGDAIAWVKANRPNLLAPEPPDPEEPEHVFGGVNDWGGNGDA